MTFEEIKGLDNKQPHIISEILAEPFTAKDFLKVKGYTITEGPALDTLRLIVKSLDELHPNNWDFEYAVHADHIDLRSIYILFDVINITNSNDDHHIIRDLLMRLSILSDNPEKQGFGLYNICGTRLTMTKEEITSNYLHSHLSSVNIDSQDRQSFTFQSFCTGSGEINGYMDRFNTRKNQTTITDLLLQLYTLVSWESIEGTPYMNMRDIRFQDGSGGGRSTQLRRVNQSNTPFIEKAIPILEKIPNSFIFEIDPKDPTNLLVRITDIGQKALFEDAQLQEYVVTEYQGSMYIYADVQYKIQMDSNTWQPRYTPTEVIKFRGENRTFKIYSEEQKTEQDDKSSNITKQFTNEYWNGLCAEIKQRCYTKASRRSMLERNC